MKKNLIICAVLALTGAQLMAEKSVAIVPFSAQNPVAVAQSMGRDQQEQLMQLLQQQNFLAQLNMIKQNQELSELIAKAVKDATKKKDDKPFGKKVAEAMKDAFTVAWDVTKSISPMVLGYYIAFLVIRAGLKRLPGIGTLIRWLEYAPISEYSWGERLAGFGWIW